MSRATDEERAGSRAYRVLRWLLGVGVHVFFRRVEVVGRENVPGPEGGAVLFCGNHSNSHMDAILLTVSSGRVLRFAAADILFRSTVLRFFLGILGAVPIRRRADHPGQELSNEDAFQSLYDVLGAGGAMGIFPEGMSHEDPDLAPMKTGPGRLALGAQAQWPELPVCIVPCGFHYTHRHRFRSTVLLQFGEPIVIDQARVLAHEKDARGAVRQLTDDLESAIRAMTVTADDWETLRLLDGVRRLYQPQGIRLEDRVELARRFNEVYPRVKDVPAVVAIRSRMKSYLDCLEILGLSDRDIMRSIGPLELAARTLNHGLLVLFHLPLALLGSPVHIPLLLLLRWGGVRFSPRTDTIAATKFLAGFLLLLMLYGAITIALWWQLGWAWGLGGLVVLPATGNALIRVLARTRAITRLVSSTTQMLLLGRQLDVLRKERKALCGLIEEAVSHLIPADMERLFPPEESG